MDIKALKHKAYKKITLGNSPKQWVRHYKILDIIISDNEPTEKEIAQLKFYVETSKEELEKTFFYREDIYYPIPWGVERWKKYANKPGFHKTTK